MRTEMRPIPGFDGYLASDSGDVYSTRTGALTQIKARMHKGYLHVFIRSGTGRASKVKRPVHQLVLLAFKGERPTPKHEGRHLDGNAVNNVPDNLEWGTRAQNVADAIAHGTHASLRRGLESLRCVGDARRRAAASHP